MLRLFLVLLFIATFAQLSISQTDPRLLWYGTFPQYNYLNYINVHPPQLWDYETNPPVLYDGISYHGSVGKDLQDPTSFYLFYEHDSRFLFYNYGIPSPLMYLGYPDWPNPAMPYYFEPNYLAGGGILSNLGPTLIIEYHISKALAHPQETPFGRLYVDMGFYPYTVVQVLLPWHRLKGDIHDTKLFGALVRRSTWKFSSPSFNNSVPFEWVTGGGFRTNPQRTLWFIDEQFNVERSPWIVPGDLFVCQAKVTYLFPYSASNPDWLWGPFDSVWDITFWSNPIFLRVPSDE